MSSSQNNNNNTNPSPASDSVASAKSTRRKPNQRVGFEDEAEDNTFDQNDQFIDVDSMIGQQQQPQHGAGRSLENNSGQNSMDDFDNIEETNSTNNNTTNNNSLENTSSNTKMMEEAQKSPQQQIINNNKTASSSSNDTKTMSTHVQRIRLSIDDLRDLKEICDRFGEVELDDFREYVGPIVRRQNGNITERDLELLFEFIDANDSKGVDWDEISMFLVRNDEMEEKRLTALEVTKFGCADRYTHTTIPKFDTQLKMLQHKWPVTKIVLHPRLPLAYSSSLREVKIWKTDQLRHVRTPFVSSKIDSVSSISLCPVWDDALLVTSYDHSISLYSAQTGDLSQIFVSERGGSRMGRRADRSGTGKRTVQREVFSVPWTDNESRQLRSDLGGRAALCGTVVSHDPLLGHLNPPRTEEATVLYDLCYVNPHSAALLPPQNSRRSAFPTCADAYVSPMTNTHKLAVGLSTGHAQFYDVESCRRVDGSSPVGLRCESIVKMHEGPVRTLKASAALGAIVSSGAQDGLIHVRNLERVDLSIPTCTLGQGIPLLDSRYAVAGHSKFTLHERDTSRHGHAHGILDVDIHEKHRLILSCAESEPDALLWSPFIVKPLAKLECGKKSLCIGVSFNQQEPHATCLSNDGIVRIFDIRTLRCLQQFDTNVVQTTTGRKSTTRNVISSSSASGDQQDDQSANIDTAFLHQQTHHPGVIAVDAQRCRVMTATNELFAHDVISSDRKDLIEGHNSTILGSSIVNRSQLNFLATFDNKDVCLWDNNGGLVVRWDQSAVAGTKKSSKNDNNANNNNNSSSNDSNNNNAAALATSPAAAAAAKFDSVLTGAVASANRRAELANGCMDTNERRLFLAASDGRVDIVNMMNGFPLKKLAPPDGLELEQARRRREQEEHEAMMSLQQQHHHDDDEHDHHHHQQKPGTVNSSSTSPTRRNYHQLTSEEQQQQKKKKLVSTIESVTHNEHNIEKTEKQRAREVERRNRLGLADNTISRSLLSEADQIRAAQKALGEVTAISYGDQEIPREGGLCAVSYSSGYAALYVDEQTAPAHPQKVLRAKECIYSVCVFPPSFVALGLAGKIAIHTLEEVGDRLTLLEPLSKNDLTHSSLHAAIVPGPLLTDPRNSSTVNLFHPVEKIPLLGSSPQHGSHHNNHNNNNTSHNNLTASTNRSFSSPHRTQSNLRGQLASAGGATTTSHLSYVSRDQRHHFGNNNNNNSRHHHHGLDHAGTATTGTTSDAGTTTSGSHHPPTDQGLLRFNQDRLHMMSIVEAMVCVNINRSEPTLISGTGAGTLHVWDIRRQLEAQRFLATVAFGEAVTAMSLDSRTHDQLAIGDSCGYVTVFDISKLGARQEVDIGARSVLLNCSVRDQFTVVSRFRAHDASVASISLGSDGYVVSASSDTIALRFSLDGSFLRVFGRYIGKEGFSSPVSWKGVSHHPAALATFDAVRARVIAKIIDTVGPQTKEQLYAQCYYVHGNKKAENLYTKKELDEVNQRVKRDDTNRIIYRQPPPKSPFFSRLYYEDSTHETMIDRLLFMMMEQIPLNGTTLSPQRLREQQQTKMNNITESNSKSSKAVPLGKTSTAASARLQQQQQQNQQLTNNNINNEINTNQLPLFPPKLHFNKENETYYRAPKHAAYNNQNNNIQNQNQQQQTSGSPGYVKRSVVEFNLEEDDDDDEENNNKKNTGEKNIEQENQSGGDKNEIEFGKMDTKTNNDNDYDSDDSENPHHHSHHAAANFFNEGEEVDESSNLELSDSSKKKNSSNNNMKLLSSAITSGSASSQQLQHTNSSTTASPDSSSVSPLKSAFDVTAMVQKSGFFEESDEDDGPLRKPVAPKHITKLKNPTDVGTLAHTLLITSPEKFMTVAPLTEEQQREKMQREKLLFGNSKLKRTYETVNNECIKIASEVIDEQRKMEIAKQRRRAWKQQQIERHQRLMRKKSGVRSPASASPSSASLGSESGQLSRLTSFSGGSDFDDDDDILLQSTTSDAHFNQLSNNLATLSSGSSSLVNHQNNNLASSSSVNNNINTQAQTARVVGSQVSSSFGGLIATKPKSPSASVSARVGGVDGRRGKRSSSKKHQKQYLFSDLSRGEGLEIATEWKHFLESDDKNQMVHGGATPRHIWLRDNVCSKPQDMLSTRGIAGAFDNNLHLAEERKQEMIRRRELGIKGGRGGGGTMHSSSDDDLSSEDGLFNKSSRKGSRHSSPLKNKVSSRVISYVGSSTTSSPHNKSFTARRSGGPNMFKSFRRHNVGSHLLESDQHRMMKRNPLDGPTGGVVFTDSHEVKKEKLYEPSPSAPPQQQQQQQQKSSNSNSNSSSNTTTMSTTAKFPHPPSNNTDEKKPITSSENEIDTEKKKQESPDKNNRNKNNDEEETTDLTEEYILSQTGGEKIRLAFPKLSRLLLEAQQLKEEQEELLQQEKEKAEKELERRARRANRRARAGGATNIIVDGTRDGATSNVDDDDDDETATSMTATTDWDTGSEFTSGRDLDDDLSDLGSEDSHERKFFDGAGGGDDDGTSDTVADRRRKRRLRRKRALERKKRREKAAEDALHYSKDGWSAKIRQLRDGELRIQATQPLGSEIPPEAFFPPKDNNAHILANILSKWHVEKVEKEKPPAAGLQGVSAAVLSSSNTAGSAMASSSQQQQNVPRGRRALDEKEIVRDWSKMNHEGIQRGK